MNRKVSVFLLLLLSANPDRGLQSQLVRRLSGRRCAEVGDAQIESDKIGRIRIGERARQDGRSDRRSAKIEKINCTIKLKE